MKSSILYSLVFTLALAGISVYQSLHLTQPRKFILATARLAQTPGGLDQHDFHGPAALLDGSRGSTSYMSYPLGPEGKNYFWLEMAVSHFPELLSAPGHNHLSRRVQTTGTPSDGLTLLSSLQPNRSIRFQRRIPDRIRITNGSCDSNLENGNQGLNYNPSGGDANTQPFVKIRRARLDFYYRPLNDPDQDFGYPQSNPVGSFEIEVPDQAMNFDFPVKLPEPADSAHFPGGMHMILLKLTILEVQRAAAPKKDTARTILDARKEGPILSICEIQYADRPAGVDESEDFFVFW